MSEEKLKPCPFCGESPINDGHQFDDKELFYKCGNSDCTLYYSDSWWSVRAWNSRGGEAGNE